MRHDQSRGSQEIVKERINRIQFITFAETEGDICNNASLAYGNGRPCTLEEWRQADYNNDWRPVSHCQSDLTDRKNYWITDRLTDRLTDWPTYWLTAEWLMTGWLTDWLTGWLTDRWTDRPTYWPTSWLTDWLIDRLADPLTCWPTDWLTDRLTDWLNDHLTKWAINWLNEFFYEWFVDVHSIPPDQGSLSLPTARQSDELFRLFMAG